MRNDGTAPAPDHTLMNDREISARRRVGAALRRLQHSVVGRSLSVDSLSILAEDLERWTKSMQKDSLRQRPVDSFTPANVRETFEGQILNAGYEERPFGGMASPFGLEFEVIRRGDTVTTELTFGPAHEGAPGRAHGGLVAGLFDDLTGFVQQLVGTVAYTGELKIRYESAVPLNTKLVARAWLHEREGRKLYIDGDLSCNDERLALVQSVFIVVRTDS
jgi:acyl-coenzyme A thioesterase PaaI-like protein